MKYYDQNGKVTSAEERRQTTERYRETLFSRVLSPRPPSPLSSASSYSRVSFLSTAGAVNASLDTSCQQGAVRAVSAHVSRRVRCRSAKKLRTKSAKVRTSSLAATNASEGCSGLTEIDDCPSKRESTNSFVSVKSVNFDFDSTTMDSPTICVESAPSTDGSSSLVSEVAPSSKENGSVSSHVDGQTRDNESKTPLMVEEAEEENNSANGEDEDGHSLQEEDSSDTQRAQNKPVFGLRIAVADFTKKVKDNEGMGISTFTYLEEGKDVVASDALAHSGDQHSVVNNIGMTEQQRKISIRSYQLYRSTLHNLTPGDKFRRAVKTINLLLRACTSRSEETKRVQKRLLTFIDYQEDIEDVEEQSQEILFDLSYFKARRERTISAEAKEIMRIHPSLRTEEQIQKVIMSLNSAVEAFGEFPVNMQESLVRVGWYEKFGPKRVIIRQGHSALNFYFMISGVTMVTVARQNRATGESYAETVAFLKKGNSFGELALMYGGKRSATVSCKDEVELLAVAREDFVDIFMSMDTDVEPDHVRFLRDIPLFRGWPIDELPYDNPSICLFTYFRRGTVLCRDSNNAEWVYVVMTGTCRIIKDLKTKDPKIQRLKTKDRIVESLPKDADARASRYYSFLHKDVSENRRSIVSSRRNSESSKGAKQNVPMPSSKKVYVQLKTLGPRDVFGLESIAFELYGESHSVTFVSDGAECVLVNRAFFLKHMNDRYLKMIRKELQPFPSVETLEEKLQASCNWNAYREYLVDHLINRRQYTESMLY